jgi:hypothetical protein
MKRVYTSLLAVCIYMTASIPQVAFAQCTCAAGVPANTIVNYATLAPTTVSTANINLPKFNPAIGNLGCVSLVDTITAVSITHVWNKAASKTKYKFQLQLNNDIEGPGGLSATSSFSKIYGPDSLEAEGLPGDSITYGPDSLYVNNIDSNGTSNTAPYLGTVGTVDFTYTINGGLTSIIGSTNYGDSITTVYSGFFKLTYYWCPTIILSTSIENFTASPNGNAYLLTWSATNEQNNTLYEIQTSTDGQHFADAGQQQSNSLTEGTTSKYQYQYNPDQANMGTIYLRIKMTDASGNVTYSVVLVINRKAGDAGAPLSYYAYPNPATNSLYFQFNSNQTGRFVLQLINTSGQIVTEQPATLTGSNLIKLDLSPQPVKGLYFLRTRDLTHNQEYISKVLIN